MKFILFFNKSRSTIYDTRLTIIAILILLSACTTKPDPYRSWTTVNGNPTGNKYSSLHR